VKKIPALFGTQKCIHKSPPMAPIMSEMKPVNTLTSCFFKMYSNISLPPLPLSSEWSFPFHFSNYVQFSLLPFLLHACQSRLFNPNNIWQKLQIMKLLIMQFSPAFTYFIMYVTSTYKKKIHFSFYISCPNMKVYKNILK
jgi:hypothetical protein